MKKAVAILQPVIEAEELQWRITEGRQIVLATVKGRCA